MYWAVRGAHIPSTSQPLGGCGFRLSAASTAFTSRPSNVSVIFHSAQVPVQAHMGGVEGSLLNRVASGAGGPPGKYRTLVL